MAEGTRANARVARIYVFRRRLPVIAVTGTSGKTTTKEMMASILKYRYGRVLKTIGNASKREHTEKLLTRVNRNVRALVLEMGMDGRGQIRSHCRLVPPSVGIITNVHRGHVGKCGGFAGVVKAKNELVYGIRRGGTLILNADDEGTKLLNISRFKGRIIWFGSAEKAHYRLLSCERQGGAFVFRVMAEGTEHQFRLRTLGEHNVHNALAAIVAARAMRIPWTNIRRGLATYRRIHGRLSLGRGVRGSYIIDDTFNANPLSVAAGLKVLKEVGESRNTIAVLGLMGEQGRSWRKVHEEIGIQVAGLKIDKLITVGKGAKAIAEGALRAGMAAESVISFKRRASAVGYLRRKLDQESLVLVKGSHSTELYKVARALRKYRRKA